MAQDGAPSAIEWLPDDNTGLVVTCTRRWVYLVDRSGTKKKATVATRALHVCVGDFVRFEGEKEPLFVTEVLPRKNCLSRHLGKRVKDIAANLDHVFVVTAVGTLFNPVFVDRVLCACFHQDIGATLVLNKVDLQIDEETEFLVEMYDLLGIPTVYTSVVDPDGLTDLREALKTATIHLISLVGISGVGKSSIMNALIPEARRETSEVSAKTGQGRQTTSQSEAIRYHGRSGEDLFFIDVPGLQNFGISQLSRRDIQAAMPDLLHFARECEYQDCHHTAEPNCAVKKALDEGAFPPSRYNSYLGMLEELEATQEY